MNLQFDLSSVKIMIQTIVVIAGGAAVVALAMRASMVVVGAIGFVSLIF